MKILVINCGSSSLKYQLIDMDNENLLAKGLCERIAIEGSNLSHTATGKETFKLEKAMENHTDAVKLVIDALLNKEHGAINSIDEISAVGHRVVHGGELFSSSVIINDEVKEAIKSCNDLAPLHNPPNLIGINACEQLMPNVKQIAVFDTSFHQTMEEKAYLYALPYEFYEKYKIRRYGFHGTSHRYVSQRAADFLGKSIEDLKIISCHLGNGASICAIEKGKSVDTSMGFTPLEGLVMGTRSGDIDPAIIKFLMEKENLSITDIDNILNKKSGVMGLSQVSSDFRDLDEAKATNKKAKAALDVFHYRVAKYIGSYASAMNGVDAIVFTAGLGENSPSARAEICSYLNWMGITVDNEKNNRRGTDFELSTDASKIKVLVIPTNEELVIARDTKELIN